MNTQIFLTGLINAIVIAFLAVAAVDFVIGLLPKKAFQSNTIPKKDAPIVNQKLEANQSNSESKNILSSETTLPETIEAPKKLSNLQLVEEDFKSIETDIQHTKCCYVSPSTAFEVSPLPLVQVKLEEVQNTDFLCSSSSNDPVVSTSSSSTNSKTASISSQSELQPINFNGWTVTQLKKEVERRKLKGRSKLRKKSELIAALKRIG